MSKRLSCASSTRSIIIYFFPGSLACLVAYALVWFCDRPRHTAPFFVDRAFESCLNVKQNTSEPSMFDEPTHRRKYIQHRQYPVPPIANLL